MYFVNENVISVSNFVDNKEMARELDRCAKIRHRALDICYSLSHYEEADLKIKNMIYDGIKSAIEKFY